MNAAIRMLILFGRARLIGDIPPPGSEFIITEDDEFLVTENNIQFITE